MKITQRMSEIALLALLVAGAVGLYLTAGSTKPASASKRDSSSAVEALSINTHYLDTARRLALTAATPEEQKAATNALDASDRELDLQYAYDLQLAASEPVSETPGIQTIQERIGRIRNAINKHQAEVDQLKSDTKRVEGSRRAALEEQLDVSKAELNLSREALGDAKDELARAGGDPQRRLEKLKAEHAAASKEHDTFKFPSLPRPVLRGSLLAKLSRWRTARHIQTQILDAQQESVAAASALSRQHLVLEKRIATEEEQQKGLAKHELTPEQIAALVAPRRRRPASASKRNSSSSGAASAQAPHETLAAQNSPNPAVVLIQRISSDRAMFRIVEHRIQAMKDLASAYAGWGVLAGTAERSALHGLIAGALWIVLIMAVAFFLNRLIEHFFAGLSLERKQKTTLQAVLRISVRLIVVVVILMMIFGKPDNLSTVVGLTGAGLAVALQDFLLSFLGWFVLMGRHGIRVGDWVEINPNAFTGVRGEVIEITLFRTVLLETGNWNESGHLTGRQVAFMNMYAVGGYYFNFSTSGQWLWDELQVAIPRTQDPYPLVEKIRDIVARATESSTQLAEREWKHVSSRYGTRSFSAQPTVNLKPTSNGVIAIVRYIARADERTATRYGLNHEIVKLFHHGEELIPGGEALADA
jgi:small-conductance mechanosensitive channel